MMTRMSFAKYKIPDGIDLEDETVVDRWRVNYRGLNIYYVGKDEPEIIESYLELDDSGDNYEIVEDEDDYEWVMDTFVNSV